MDAWPTILAAVTNPLSLAGLAILVLSSVFVVALKLRRVSNRAAVARIARYTFLISLVTLVGGLAAYTAIELFGSELRISGTIRDTYGDPVEDVAVSIDGGPSTTSHEDGSFEMTIVRSRFRSGIVVVVRDPLYKVARQERTANLGAPFSFVLEELPRDYHVLQNLDFLRIGHWLGQTWIQAGMVLENKNYISLTIKGVVAKTFSQDGEVRQVPWFRFNAAVPAINPNAELRLRTNRIQRLDTEFYQPLARPDLVSAINMATAAHGDQISISKNKPYFSSDLSSELQEIARTSLLWKAGHWRVEICVLMEGGTDCKTWAFDITAAQATALSDIITLYPSGIGVLTGYRFSNNPKESGFVEIAPTEVQ